MFWFMIVHMTVVKEQKVHPIASMLANSQYIENERKMVKLTIIKEIYSNPPPLPPIYHTFTVRTFIRNYEVVSKSFIIKELYFRNVITLSHYLEINVGWMPAL